MRFPSIACRTMQAYIRELRSNKIDVLSKLGRAQVGDLVAYAAIEVGEEPVNAGASRQQVCRAVVGNGGAGAIRLEKVVAVQTRAASHAQEVGHAGGII